MGRATLVTLRAGALLAIALIASGCAHTLVYDESRDRQAQETQKAVTDAHVANTVAALDEAFAKVAAREEAAARERQEDLFDLEVRTIARARSLDSKFDATDGIDGLMTVVRARLGVLGLNAPVDTQLENLRRQEVSLRADLDGLQVTLAEFRGTVGPQLRNCTEVYAASAAPDQKSKTPSKRFLASIPAARRTLAGSKFQALVESCARVDTSIAAQKTLYGSSDGLVGKLAKHLEALDRDILAYEVAKTKAQADIDAATAVFRNSGAREATDPGRSKLESLENRAQSLRDVIASIATAGGLGAQHAIAAEKLQRLESLLAAIAGTPEEGTVPLTEDQEISVAIVRDLPALADEARKLFAEAAKPRLVPFLAAIDHQKRVLKGLEAGQNARRKQAEAARNALQAALGEGVALARVLQPLTRDASWAARSIADLERNLPGASKSSLHRALAIYAGDVRQLRIDGAVWAVRERAAMYEEGLSQSKFIAAQWDGLMDTIAKVLADYHAAGIKQTDIAEFFKALGLITIGVGVAQ